MIVFFFQAEDGIRDLVRSRGLGDVYKRQDHVRVGGPAREAEQARGRRPLIDPGRSREFVNSEDALRRFHSKETEQGGFSQGEDGASGMAHQLVLGPVSYTHLTLPTSDLV